MLCSTPLQTMTSVRTPQICMQGSDFALFFITKYEGILKNYFHDQIAGSSIIRMHVAIGILFKNLTTPHLRRRTFERN